VGPEGLVVFAARVKVFAGVVGEGAIVSGFAEDHGGEVGFWVTSSGIEVLKNCNVESVVPCRCEIGIQTCCGEGDD
jgi:hypothetical protein